MKISVRKSDFPVSEDEIEPMEIGHVPYCVNCGDEIGNAEHLQCDYCHKDAVTCECCGDRIDRDDAYYDEHREAYYCGNCVTYCIAHGEYEYEGDCHNRARRHTRWGWEEGYICDDAVDWCGDWYYCPDCDIYYHSDDIVECLDGEYRCVECAEEWERDHCVVCEDCGDTIMKEDAHLGSDNKYRCDDCYEAWLESEDNDSENETEISKPENENVNSETAVPVYDGGSTWKMRCVNNRYNERNYTTGKVYEVVNGKLTVDAGYVWDIPELSNFCTWVSFSGSVWELVA